MPGVYRNSDGTYTYQAANDYEDRRRRDLDDQAAGRPPFGPRPDPPPSISWNPPPQPAPEQPTPAPANDSGLEIITAAVEAAERAQNEAFFDRLVGALPNQVGESPAFDQLYDDPNTPVVNAVDLIEQLGPDGNW